MMIGDMVQLNGVVSGVRFDKTIGTIVGVGDIVVEVGTDPCEVYADTGYSVEIHKDDTITNINWPLDLVGVFRWGVPPFVCSYVIQEKLE